MTTKKAIISIFLLLLPSALFAFEKNHDIHIEYSFVSQNAQESITIAQIAQFFQHLPEYYNDIHPGHELLQLQNTSVVEKNANLYNKEHSGGQYVEHHYIVATFQETSNDFLIELNSDHSTVRKGPFKFPCTVIFRFHAQTTSNHTTHITATLDIDFPKKRHLLLAKLAHTQKIWQQHLIEEIQGGLNVIQTL